MLNIGVSSRNRDRKARITSKTVARLTSTVLNSNYNAEMWHNYNRWSRRILRIMDSPQTNRHP